VLGGVHVNRREAPELVSENFQLDASPDQLNSTPLPVVMVPEGGMSWLPA
jgi:hypothetical protein